jgi:5-methylcytosine-specific restriction endonuclease McrA
MTRRRPYTKVVKENQIRPEHVKGMGDVVFKGFSCLNSDCQEFIFARKDQIEEGFSIVCPSCGYVLLAGGESVFYDYKLVNIQSGKVIEDGRFVVSHDEYVAEAQEYKYCIICGTLKPLDFFDRHSARKSGRQGECRLCKTIYNSIKNQTRIIDQHREASEKRRLYGFLSKEPSKIDAKAIYDRFGQKCFRCSRKLHYPTEGNIDHTLPAKLFWPISTGPTLLCSNCNNIKHGKWPSEVYTERELKKLAVYTGIKYKILSGKPLMNPDAVKWLVRNVDHFIERWIRYPDEIMRIRRLVLEMTGKDIFAYAKIVPKYLKDS